jgi:predicted kinase
MAPKHDEISKRLDDGLYLVWDTTNVDRDRMRKVSTVSRRQAAQLGEIVERTPMADSGQEAPTARRRATIRPRGRDSAG